MSEISERDRLAGEYYENKECICDRPDEGMCIYHDYEADFKAGWDACQNILREDILYLATALKNETPDNTEQMDRINKILDNVR